MTDFYDDVDALAKQIAQLPEADRTTAIKRFQHVAVMAAPADEVAKPPITQLGPYLDIDIPAPPSVIEPGLMVRGSITVLTSPGSGKGKTTVSLNRILRWAAGKPLFEDLPDVLAPREPVKTLIIENEGAAGLFHHRISAMAKHLGAEGDLDAIRENVFVWGDGGYSALKLDDEGLVDLVRRGVEQCEPDIIMLEPLRGLWRGEENSSTELSVVMDALHAIANDYDLAVQLTHHERKSGAGDSGEAMYAVRGSVILSDLAAVVERWRTVQAGSLRELYWTKCRYGQAPAPIRMKFDPLTWCYEHVPEDVLEREVLKALGTVAGEWMSTEEVSDIIEEAIDKARKVLNKLFDQDRIKKTRGVGGGFVWRVGGESAEEGMGY